MELSITTPALLFPALSLLMLAYTNRFLALANLIRSLHAQYLQNTDQKHLLEQIRSLRARIKLVRSMQAFGALGFLFCILCMFCIFEGWERASYVIFAVTIITFVISLIFSLIEIYMSTQALEVELSDIEELSRSNIFSEIVGSKDN